MVWNEWLYLLNLKYHENYFLEGLIIRLGLPDENTGHSAKIEFQRNK